MFAAMPFAFSLGLEAGAVHEQVRRPLGTATGNDDIQGLLPPGKGAEIRPGPAQPGQLQQARHKAGGLA